MATRDDGSSRFNAKLIKDENIRSLLERESKLKSELSALRKPMRDLQDKKDASIRTFQPKQEKFMSGIDGEWDTLQKEKNRLHGEMDKIKVQNHERQQLIDDLRMVGLEVEPLRRDLVESRAKTNDIQKQIRELEEKRTRTLAGLRFKSQSQADDEIAKIDKDIAQASKKGDQKLLSAFAKQRAAAEKAKKDVLASYGIDDRLIAAKKKEAVLVAAQDAAQEKFDEKDSARNKIREKLDAAPKRAKNDENDPYKKLLDRVKAINAKLDDLRNKRKESKPVNTELDAVNASITEHKAKRDAINKELDDIREKLPIIRVTYDATYRGDVIGRGGATLEQLQADFGVALATEGDNTLLLIGASDDCEAVKEAVEAIVEDAKENRQKKTVPFDMKLVRAFIGAGGSNIQKLQQASGADIKLKKEENEIELTGNSEAISTATELINDFIANNASDELKFDASLRDVVLGKGGSTIRRIESESGVKRLHVERDRCVIAFSGTADAVAKAKAAYVDLIEGMTSNAFTMRVDDRMTRLVIGTGGKTINEIQDTTGALVEARNGAITIRGGKDAVAAARAMIEDITRREEIKLPFDSFLYSTLIARPLLTQEEDEDGERVQQEEGETPLEEIKRVTGCDQVSAIRSESKVVVRGKQQCVNQARTMLHELFMSLRPDVVRVPYHDILISTLVKRGADKYNQLDRIKLKYPSLLHVDLNRVAKVIEVAGGKEDVEAAGTELKTFIDEAKASMKTIGVQGYQIGAILGSNGSTINELQKKHNCEINIDRDANQLTVWIPGGDQEALDTLVTAIDELKASARK